MDGTQTGSVRVAIGKARSAALYKRPTKVWQDLVAGGGAGLRILGLEGAVPIEGGLPLLMDDKIVGAIGVSGGTAAQDGVVATAGAGASNKVTGKASSERGRAGRLPAREKFPWQNETFFLKSRFWDFSSECNSSNRNKQFWPGK